MTKKLLAIVALLSLIPAVEAAPLTPWDAIEGKTFRGRFVITRASGEKLKGAGQVTFAPGAAKFSWGLEVPKQDVKQIEIKEPGEEAFHPWWAPLEFVFFPTIVAEWDGRRMGWKDIPWIVLAEPVCVGVTAVTAPVEYAVKGIRLLRPARVVYRIVP